MTNRDILDELRVRGELAERLKRMAPRFREIITLRYGLSFETGLIVRGEMTLEQVAQLYSITTECLRQIEKRAFKELSEGLTDSPWHTGTPTEEGLYAVYYWDDHNPSATPYEVLYDGFLSPDGEGNWIDRDGEIGFIDDDIVRWQKIDEYREEK